MRRLALRAIVAAEKEVSMAAFPHETPSAGRARPALFEMPELWAAIAIVVIWLAVLFDGVWGPDILTHDVSGTGSSVPSVVVVAPCAVLATWLIARHAFRRERG